MTIETLQLLGLVQNHKHIIILMKTFNKIIQKIIIN